MRDNICCIHFEKISNTGFNSSYRELSNTVIAILYNTQHRQLRHVFTKTITNTNKWFRCRLNYGENRARSIKCWWWRIIFIWFYWNKSKIEICMQSKQLVNLISYDIRIVCERVIEEQTIRNRPAPADQNFNQPNQRVWSFYIILYVLVWTCAHARVFQFPEIRNCRKQNECSLKSSFWRPTKTLFGCSVAKFMTGSGIMKFIAIVIRWWFFCFVYFFIQFSHFHFHFQIAHLNNQDFNCLICKVVWPRCFCLTQLCCLLNCYDRCASGGRNVTRNGMWS